MRPRQYLPAKKPPTTEERVATVEQTTAQQGETIATVVETVDGLPPTETIWSDNRPTATFGAGSELTWTATGNGASNTFAIPGRLSTNPARYVVIVGGVTQPPGCFSLSATAETLTFAEAPPAGVTVAVHAPFYGSAT